MNIRGVLSTLSTILPTRNWATIVETSAITVRNAIVGRSKCIIDTIVIGKMGHAIDQKKPCTFMATKYR